MKNWTGTECPIWGTAAKRNPFLSGDITEFYSPRAGGRFKISGSAIPMLTTLKNKPELSLQIVKGNVLGQVPEIDTATLHGLSTLPPLRTMEKFNLFLRILYHLNPSYGTLIKPKQGEVLEFLRAALESNHINSVDPEISVFLNHALDKGYLEQHPAGDLLFSLKGFDYLETLGARLSESDQIFVAMWFGSPRLKCFYQEAILPAIIEAGYSPMRIDNSEHNEKIDDQIISEIRKSKALVVDISCGLAKPEGWSGAEIVGAPRGGVFYEAGFAKGIDLPVIWMVDQKIAEVENVSHFDIRQYNQIRWGDDFEEAKERLQNRIEATLGRGNYTQVM